MLIKRQLLNNISFLLFFIVSFPSLGFSFSAPDNVDLGILMSLIQLNTRYAVPFFERTTFYSETLAPGVYYAIVRADEPAGHVFVGPFSNEAAAAASRARFYKKNSVNSALAEPEHLIASGIFRIDQQQSSVKRSHWYFVKDDETQAVQKLQLFTPFVQWWPYDNFLLNPNYAPVSNYMWWIYNNGNDGKLIGDIIYSYAVPFPFKTIDSKSNNRLTMMAGNNCKLPKIEIEVQDWDGKRDSLLDLPEPTRSEDSFRFRQFATGRIELYKKPYRYLVGVTLFNDPELGKVTIATGFIELKDHRIRITSIYKDENIRAVLAMMHVSMISMIFKDPVTGKPSWVLPIPY